MGERIDMIPSALVLMALTLFGGGFGLGLIIGIYIGKKNEGRLKCSEH